jgi:ketosteroid isomerase-like protein
MASNVHRYEIKGETNMRTISTSTISRRTPTRGKKMMKLTLVTTILATAVSSFPFGKAQAKTRGGDTKAIADVQTEQTLRRIEGGVCEALVKGDTTALERLWADSYTLTPPNGMVISKADYIAMLKSGDVEYEILKPEDVKVQVYGDTAVVTGLATVKGKALGHTFDGRDRYLTVYVRRNRQWQQVATQASRVAR